MIVDERLTFGGNSTVNNNGAYVLYWAEISPRVSWNYALSFAIETAERTGKPLVVYFGITDDYPEANLRHYTFMVEGLIEFYSLLKQMNIRMVIGHCSPEKGAAIMARNAVMVVADMPYLTHQRRNHLWLEKMIEVPFVQVESNLIVPVRSASSKEEYSAATLRRKIWRMVHYFSEHDCACEYRGQFFDDDLPLDDIYDGDAGSVITRLDIDRSVEPVSLFKGGESRAKGVLDYFIEHHLDRYSEFHNDPLKEYSSSLSPYLHFGQISPVDIYRKVAACDCEDKKDFLEQLVVRRHLAFNYVFYNPQYDSYESIPQWAKKTLGEHSSDIRPYLYTFDQLEKGITHDPYWNAAQKDLRENGTMHNYMRMYWGKKIIEWSEDPLIAFQTALKLNNRYQLDGRDPNGYAGVAWCFGKHDRPWSTRAVFGSVRYMNDKGLKRKFDIKQYPSYIDSKVNSGSEIR